MNSLFKIGITSNRPFKVRLVSRGSSSVVRNPLLVYTLAFILSVLCTGGIAAKEPRGVYVGLAVPIGGLDASFHKSVDTTSPNTLVPEPHRGMVLRDKAVGEGSIYAAGFSAGFQVALGDTGVYLGGQAEIDFGDGEVNAQFDGVGASPRRNQLGELWPDQRTYEGDRGYGLAIRLSAKPAALRSMDLRVYALAGVRWLEGALTSEFYGCTSPTPCSSAQDTPNFTLGMSERDVNLDGWMIGLGAEKAIRDQFALRFESRYTSYETKRWMSQLDDVGITFRSALEAESWDLVFSLVWYLR